MSGRVFCTRSVRNSSPAENLSLSCGAALRILIAFGAFLAQSADGTARAPPVITAHFDQEVIMKPKAGLLGICVIAAAFAATPLSFAQEGPASPEPSASPSTSDHYTGAGSVKHSARDAASEATTGARNAYHAVKRSTKNTAITTEAKAALLKDPATRHSSIHVTTRSGVVTLTGKVDSSGTAQHAQQVIARLEGVRAVRNRLKYPMDENNPPADEHGPAAAEPGNAGSTMPQPGMHAPER
ncbi:MAG TPA: BON domain-containing protein [Candidatus Binataceae bacterium]|jgi:hypothetical protein|nr:BON domain-containing protein [Candidatus Binataceae bacterium]